MADLNITGFCLLVGLVTATFAVSPWFLLGIVFMVLWSAWAETR